MKNPEIYMSEQLQILREKRNQSPSYSDFLQIPIREYIAYPCQIVHRLEYEEDRWRKISYELLASACLDAWTHLGKIHDVLVYVHDEQLISRLRSMEFREDWYLQSRYPLPRSLLSNSFEVMADIFHRVPQIGFRDNLLPDSISPPMNKRIRYLCSQIDLLLLKPDLVNKLGDELDKSRWSMAFNILRVGFSPTGE